MVAGGVEVVVGATLDLTFGPLVLYGSGGILVELLNDVAFRINPLTDTDVHEMMNEVKGTALLRGYRGSRPADEAALSGVDLASLSAARDMPTDSGDGCEPGKVSLGGSDRRRRACTS